jgi:putative peptidoglycan lipid II flippase
MSILMMPATMGMAVAQVNIFVSTILASYLSQGSITYLYYSMRLIQFPIGIFGVAMGMAVLPTLSEHAVRGEMDKLREDFSFALRLLFFITVPAMIGLIALRVPVVNILFQRGMFDYRATVGTADALLFYATGIWAIVGVRIVTATFYSLNDTRTPVKVAAAAVVINIIMSLLLMNPLKHSGLAFANAIASSVNFILLFYFLRRRLGRIDAKRILKSFMKICVASIIMGVLGWRVLHGEMWMASGRVAEKTLYLSGTIVVCVGIYLTINFLLKGDEMNYLYDRIKDRLRRGTA